MSPVRFKRKDATMSRYEVRLYNRNSKLVATIKSRAKSDRGAIKSAKRLFIIVLWKYLEVIDLEDGCAIAGATAGTKATGYEPTWEVYV